MINNTHFAPSFQKRLLATTSLKDYCGDEVPCKIYELDSQEDALYLNNQLNRGAWMGNYFLDTIYKNFAEDKSYTRSNINFYTLEKENGDLLGYLNEIKNNDKTRSVLYLETVPTMAKNSKSREIKGIGETMLSFLASYTIKSKDIEKICIDMPSDSARWFYEKLGFKKFFSMSSSMYLPFENMPSLIRKNEERNGSKINFVEEV